MVSRRSIVAPNETAPFSYAVPRTHPILNTTGNDAVAIPATRRAASPLLSAAPESSSAAVGGDTVVIHCWTQLTSGDHGTRKASALAVTAGNASQGPGSFQPVPGFFHSGRFVGVVVLPDLPTVIQSGRAAR